MRTPVRAWFICIAAMGMMSMLFLEKLNRKWQLLFVMFYLLESIPFNYPVYPSDKFYPTSLELKAIQQSAGPEGLVLHLPSHIAIDAPDASQYPDPLFSEYLYAVWQTRYQRNALNGFNGLLPQSRIYSDRIIQQATAEGNPGVLKQKYPVNCVVWHYEVAKAGWGEQQWQLIKNLKPVYRDQHIAVFAL